MTIENISRLMLLAIIALFMPIGLYYRFRSFTGERLSRRDEGLFVMVALRLAGLGFWLGLLAYLINPAWVNWSEVPLPGYLRWSGFPLGTLAVLWCGWMLHTLGSNLTDTVNVRATATLVTSGPYRWVRHPMYLGVVALVVSVSVIAASALIAFFGALVVAMILVRTPTEEAKLMERFGGAYRQYASRTGRYLPRLP